MTEIFTKEDMTKLSIMSRRWMMCRKITPTMVLSILGPFEVKTMHGFVRCEDGYLAVDHAGWPYPIDRDVFEKTYKTTRLEQDED